MLTLIFPLIHAINNESIAFDKSEKKPTIRTAIYQMSYKLLKTIQELKKYCWIDSHITVINNES